MNNENKSTRGRSIESNSNDLTLDQTSELVSSSLNRSIESNSNDLTLDQTSELVSSSLNRSIHEFDFSLICEYFSGVERQGPGSPEVTLKALSFIDYLSADSFIADIGCGTGGQTMVLAQHAPGHVTGVDLFPDFIHLFNRNAARLHLQDSVEGVVGSMDNLPFRKESLNLIWSEGAIYNIGFEKGINEWKQFLKKDGYLAVSEVSWFTDKRPAEINDYWIDAYPEIDTIPNKVAQMQKAGYIPVATFIIPETCWTEHFYIPQIPVQEAFLKKYAGNKTAEDLIAEQRREAQLYNTYKNYYGYVFYIGRKI
ncbi:MAG: methyltransferase domain-containing protein [Tannerella sp.]|jgi:SAM-dependent methyltransferase|nr:methyltransferase domain-containing protein [Tannerella sp.]